MKKIKNNKIYYLIGALSAFFIILIIPAQAVQAAAIGVSPSEIIIDVEQGTVTTTQLTLSRSETIGDYLFSVELGEESSMIQLSSDSMTINDGVQFQEYEITIDATDAELGLNENTIGFYMVPQGQTSGQVVRFGLVAKSKVNVIEPGTLEAVQAAAAEQAAAEQAAAQATLDDEKESSSGPSIITTYTHIYSELPWYIYLILAMLCVSISTIVATYVTFLRRVER